MNFEYKYLLLIVGVYFIVSCTTFSTTTDEGEEQLAISEIPKIELISVIPNQVQEFTDSIIFKIKYTDGNGDLGSFNPDATPIEIKDNRDESLIFRFPLQPLSPANSNIIIQGELDIVLKNIILLDDNNQMETTNFSIRIKDEANQWSNIVSSESVTVVR